MIQFCSLHLKLYPNGHIAGFDIPTVLSVCEALGYDLQALLLLIEYAEAGLREAVKKHGDSSSEHFRQDRGH